MGLKKNAVTVVLVLVIIGVVCAGAWAMTSKYRSKEVTDFYDNNIDDVVEITIFNSRVNGISNITVKPKYYEYVTEYFDGYTFTPRYDNRVVDDEWSYVYNIKTRERAVTITFNDTYCVIDGAKYQYNNSSDKSLKDVWEHITADMTDYEWMMSYLCQISPEDSAWDIKTVLGVYTDSIGSGVVTRYYRYGDYLVSTDKEGTGRFINIHNDRTGENLSLHPFLSEQAEYKPDEYDRMYDATIPEEEYVRKIDAAIDSNFNAGYVKQGEAIAPVQGEIEGMVIKQEGYQCGRAIINLGELVKSDGIKSVEYKLDNCVGSFNDPYSENDSLYETTIYAGIMNVESKPYTLTDISKQKDVRFTAYYYYTVGKSIDEQIAEIQRCLKDMRITACIAYEDGSRETKTYGIEYKDSASSAPENMVFYEIVRR